MTSDELAAAEARLRQTRAHPVVLAILDAKDAEIERLRGLLELASDLAEGSIVPTNDSGEMRCDWCGNQSRGANVGEGAWHATDCLVPRLFPAAKDPAP